MTTPDVRAFYSALGIELPGWPKLEAPVRCFAHPDAHNHGDRSPSCSVNLASGAWNCHGCGAHGGAYDAALALGHSPRSAMELLIAHGLAEPRTPRPAAAPARPRHQPRPATPHRREPAATLAADEQTFESWAETLDANSRLIRRLRSSEHGRRGSSEHCRSDSTAPGSRSRSVTRTGPSRHPPLRPVRPTRPKDARRSGTRLGLIPHPASEPSRRIILVEGPRT